MGCVYQEKPVCIKDGVQFGSELELLEVHTNGDGPYKWRRPIGQFDMWV